MHYYNIVKKNRNACLIAEYKTDGVDWNQILFRQSYLDKYSGNEMLNDETLD